MDMEALNIPDGYLLISWYTANTDCLGPGRRFALWVQGCRQRCSGCIAQALQDVNGGELMSIDMLVEKMTEAPEIEGLSISGGEPFLQAAGLAELLRKVKQLRPELGVILYTGLLYEQLNGSEDAAVLSLLGQVDLLVDGAYVQQLDDGRGMRGSSNQRLLFLTQRYSASVLPEGRKNHLLFSRGSFRMIGIPSNGARLLADVFKQSDKERNK